MRKKSLLLLFDIVIPCNYLYDEISSHISNQCEIWKEEFAYQGRGVKFRLITVHSKTKKAPEVDYKYYIQKLGSSEYDSSDAFLALKFF